MKPTKLNILLRDVNHDGNAPQDAGSGEWRNGIIQPCGMGVGFDALRNPRGMPHQTFFTNFANGIPADALAAGADPLMITLGTNDEAATLAGAFGGVRLSSAADPADEDSMMLKPGATAMAVAGKIAASGLLFESLVSVPESLADSYVYAGLNENVSAVDPSATAGDGAGFFYCEYDQAGNITVNPTTAANGGLVEADFANWILHQKVNGTDYFYRTDVPVVIGVPYVLTVEIGADLKPTWKINGVEVGELASGALSTLVFKYALTSGDTVQPFFGRILKENLAAVRNLDIAYVLLQRFIL